MTFIVSVSRQDLAQRRQKLRRQRQARIITAIWRTFAVTCFAGGLFWISVQPIWVLQSPRQIVMKSGNHLLPEKTIKSLLKLSYPQSLWRIQPDAIAKSLQQQPAIAQVYVSRRLFPPGLMINIEERVPVAIAQRLPQSTNSLGLIDAKGVWMPLEKYISLSGNLKLPILRVIGSPEQYQPYWFELYQALSQSYVKVTEVDCQDSSNLILKTELGKVHLGIANTQLNEKIKVLSQIRHLPSKLNLSQVEYIDLKNPAIPLVQMIDLKREQEKYPHM